MDPKDYLTIAISVVALVVSLVSLAQKVPENRRTIRNQLTDVIGKLNTINAEARKLEIERAVDRHSPEVNGTFSFLNDQRSFLVRQAVFLAEQISDHVTSPELAVIARAFDSIGDQEAADFYWARCVEKSTSYYMKAINLRGLARYQFRWGNYEVGRQSYLTSIATMNADNDHSAYTNGETYLRWAIDERDNRFAAESEKLYGLADESFHKVNHEGRRQHGLRSIAASRVAVAPVIPKPA